MERRPKSVCLNQFCSQIGQISYPRRVCDLPRNALKVGERRRIRDRFRIFVGVDHRRFVALRCVLPEADQRRIFILGNIIVEVDECGNLLGSRAVRVQNRTAPDIT